MCNGFFVGVCGHQVNIYRPGYAKSEFVSILKFYARAFASRRCGFTHLCVGYALRKSCICYYVHSESSSSRESRLWRALWRWATLENLHFNLKFIRFVTLCRVRMRSMHDARLPDFWVGRWRWGAWRIVVVVMLASLHWFVPIYTYTYILTQECMLVHPLSALDALRGRRLLGHKTSDATRRSCSDCQHLKLHFTRRVFKLLFKSVETFCLRVCVCVLLWAQWSRTPSYPFRQTRRCRRERCAQIGDTTLLYANPILLRFGCKWQWKYMYCVWQLRNFNQARAQRQ